MALFKLTEAAKQIRLSPCTLRRLVYKGEVQYRRIGGRIFFAPDDIEKFLEKSIVPMRESSIKEAQL